MHHWLRHLIVVLTVALAPLSAYGDVRFEFGMLGGYTGNLLKDSSQLSDSYVSRRVSIDLYPVSMARINLLGENAGYRDVSALGSLLYGGGVTLIPTGDSSRISLYLAATAMARDFRGSDSAFRTGEFNSSDYTATASLGYQVSQSMSLRLGYTYRSIGYSHEEVRSKIDHDIIAGVNLSFLGANSLDLEGGYTQGNLDYLWAWQTIPGIDTLLPRGRIKADSAYAWLDEGELNSVYVSPRFSRPLGDRTGLSVALSHRSFTNRDPEALIYGYSTGYLSPWVQSYEGNALLVTMKSYLIPRLIVSGGFGYWDRSFLDVIEAKPRVDPGTGDTALIVTALNNIQKRNDDRRQAFVYFQLPLPPQSGFTAEATLRLEYTSNSSSVVVYDYTDFSATAGVRFRF
ncbi:MAG: hypothetical protein JSU65_13130 [Candidatus Zixiibacteriota bacterium]|nr:MAG: hypothetical protein JSU65_13130 [candidate division Zixibacteria bacterium]